MTEQSASAIGTVAQEAARLIEDMAAMARSGNSRGDGFSPYAGEQAQESASPDLPDTSDATGERRDEAGGYETGTRDPRNRGTRDGETRDRQSGDRETRDGETRDRQSGDRESRGQGDTDGPPAGACSLCGAEGDGIPATCRVCPLCRGIALMRSVRPETVDLLADLALSLAASLRDVAMKSRASDSASSARSASGGPPDGDRAPVQDIQVDDESEG